MRIFENECHLLIPTRGMNRGHFFIAEFSTPKKKAMSKSTCIQHVLFDINKK